MGMINCGSCGKPTYAGAYCSNCGDNNRWALPPAPISSKPHQPTQNSNGSFFTFGETRQTEQVDKNAAEAARLAAIAEEEARQRRIELQRLHTQWLNGINNETAKSVFIFNSVKITVHNHLDDSWFSDPEEIYCQEGKITYNKKLFDFHKLNIDTDNNVTTFSNGRVFKRSGDYVYGNDGSFFKDPVPSHLSIARNPELERRFNESCVTALEKKRETNKKRIKAGLVVAGAIFAGSYIAEALNDTPSSPSKEPESRGAVQDTNPATNATLDSIETKTPQPLSDNFLVAVKPFDLFLSDGTVRKGKTVEQGSCLAVSKSAPKSTAMPSAYFVTADQAGGGGFSLTGYVDPANVAPTLQGEYTENNCWAMFRAAQGNQEQLGNDASVAFALGANGNFFIVKAEALNLRSNWDSSSAIKMIFAQGSCLMSAGTGNERNGFVSVIAMSGGKKSISGYVSAKYIEPAPRGTNEVNCIAITAPQ